MKTGFLSGAVSTNNKSLSDVEFYSKKGGNDMAIPKDPIMLLSYINTQLRDFYPSVEELCSALDLDKQDLENKILEAGCQYDPSVNQFR